MSEDQQRPAAVTFEEAFRDVQPRPDLIEATLMARYPELQVEAERVRRARQEEEQAVTVQMGVAVSLHRVYVQ
jgi:hypothetical protein